MIGELERVPRGGDALFCIWRDITGIKKAQTALEEKTAYLEELGEQVRALRDQGLSPRRIREQLQMNRPIYHRTAERGVSLAAGWAAVGSNSTQP